MHESSDVRDSAAGPDPQAARTAFRACARRLLRSPAELVVHLDRLDAAQAMAGSEPVQGALADLFHGCAGRASPAQLMSTLQAVRQRLNPHIAQQFEHAALLGGLPRCTRLATRWCVLAATSLDVMRRERRCSGDQSRERAERAIQAWQAQDDPTLEAFLEHCRVCRDALAFMHVRREILRSGQTLPRRWQDIFLLLQAAARSP